jgi:hypothetical protein
MSTYHRRQRGDVFNALDEIRFGSQRTLNLRESMPTAADATARTEAWLRERQVSVSGEVLIVTGRGKGSPGGVGVVREAIVKLLASLRRRGVITEFADHTQGSFIVRLAPMSDLLQAPRRNRDRSTPEPETGAAPALEALEPSTRALLRRLAEGSLSALGATLPSHFVDAEMIRQFNILAAGVASGHGGEERLRQAIARAIDEMDEA